MAMGRSAYSARAVIGSPMRSFEQRTDRVEQTCRALLAAGGSLGPRAVHAVEVHTLLGERQSGARTIAVLRRFENDRRDGGRRVDAVEPHVVGVDDPLVRRDVGVGRAELRQWA